VRAEVTQSGLVAEGRRKDAGRRGEHSRIERPAHLESETGGSFKTVHVHPFDPGLDELLGKLLGEMEVPPGKARGGEPSPALPDQPLPRRGERVTEGRCAGRRELGGRLHDGDPGRGDEARDRRSEDPPPGPDHANGLTESLQTVGPVKQVVQRPEQERCVVAVVSILEVASISDAGDERTVSDRGLDVVPDRVHQHDTVPALRERRSVNSRGATNVDDAGSCRYTVTDHLLGPLELQDALTGTSDEPVGLVELRPVVRHEAPVDPSLADPSLVRHPVSMSHRQRTHHSSLGSTTWDASRVEYDPTQFLGAARYYRQGRPPYSAELCDVLRRELGLDGSGGLLDVGSGPGTVGLRIAPLFEHVTLLEPDADMLAEARAQAAAQRVGTVDFVKATAEELADLNLPPMRTVTFGQSFHRTDRVQVAEAVWDTLAPGGTIVLITHDSTRPPPQQLEGTPPIPHGDIDRLLRTYLGPERRSGARPAASYQSERFEETLARTRFGRPRVVHAPGRPDIVRDVDGVIAGYLSTSFAAPHLFGSRLDDFVADLHDLLDRVSRSGRFWDWPGDTEILIAERR
jgi:SAM-dependent methyltransferase